jgi:cell division protein ZapA (FtsZ GTPase activity inhibitor)
METLAIKVKIGDREYPMRVKSEDEGKIRHAGKLINEKLRKYKAEFGLDDTTDLLAMVAFDCMVESLETNEGNAEDSEHIHRSLSHISSLLKKAV